MNLSPCTNRRTESFELSESIKDGIFWKCFPCNLCVEVAICVWSLKMMGRHTGKCFHHLDETNTLYDLLHYCRRMETTLSWEKDQPYINALCTVTNSQFLVEVFKKVSKTVKDRDFSHIRGMIALFWKVALTLGRKTIGMLPFCLCADSLVF